MSPGNCVQVERRVCGKSHTSIGNLKLDFQVFLRLRRSTLVKEELFKVAPRRSGALPSCPKFPELVGRRISPPREYSEISVGGLKVPASSTRGGASSEVLTPGVTLSCRGS